MNQILKGVCMGFKYAWCSAAMTSRLPIQRLSSPHLIREYFAKVKYTIIIYYKVCFSLWMPKWEARIEAIKSTPSKSISPCGVPVPIFFSESVRFTWLSVAAGAFLESASSTSKAGVVWWHPSKRTHVCESSCSNAGALWSRFPEISRRICVAGALGNFWWHAAIVMRVVFPKFPSKFLKRFRARNDPCWTRRWRRSLAEMFLLWCGDTQQLRLIYHLGASNMPAPYFTAHVHVSEGPFADGSPATCQHASRKHTPTVQTFLAMTTTGRYSCSCQQLF